MTQHHGVGMFYLHLQHHEKVLSQCHACFAFRFVVFQYVNDLFVVENF